MRPRTLLLTIFFSISLLFASNVCAADLKLNYSLFFGYMKTLYKLNYNYVTTAFYLTDKKSKQPCRIKNAVIVVDDSRQKINFDKIGRLRPLLSQKFYQAGAMIEISLLKPRLNKECDLNVTLMAKESELNKLSYGKMKIISSELDGLLRKNAGMIGQYFLPPFEGLILVPAQVLTKTQMSQLDTRIKIDKRGNLLISNKTLNALDQKKLLHVSVTKITPWIMVP